MTNNAKAVLEVGELIMRFAQVTRTTFHQDGATPESDTDHTVMLSVCACALAQKLYPDLDLGLVAQFAIVHDLVEAYAGDVDTFGLTETDRKTKRDNESVALSRLQTEFGETMSWIPDMIVRFERLDTPEARFVKTVDKLMPKITHVLNQGATYRARGLDKETMWQLYQENTRPSEVKHGEEFPEIVALMDELILETRKLTYGS